MLDLFTSAAGMLSGGGAIGGIQAASDLIGGGSDQSKSSAQAGDFYGGSLNITKEDSTIKYAMIIGGVILLFAIAKRFK